MCAYNTAEYIDEAIQSILGQTYTNFEFIILDDCSTDNTWDKIKKYSLKDKRIVAIKNKKNLRIPRARDKIISIVQGKYLAVMDSDDYSYPNRLEKQVIFMDNNPDIVVSGSNVEVCDSNLKVLNKRVYNFTDQKIREKLFRYSPFCHPATIYKTDIVKKIGGYNEALDYGAEDYDLYFRLGLYGKFGNIEDILFKLRTHQNSISQKKTTMMELATLYIRIKAVMEYGYKMNLTDKLYFIGQYLGMFVIPPKIKFRLFNIIRANNL